MNKELSAIVKHSSTNNNKKLNKEKFNFKKRLLLLHKMLKVKNNFKNFNLGIFGSSISAMWFYGGLKTKINFFVDEDISKVGNFYKDIPIISPNNVPKNSKIFVPLDFDLAKKIAKKFNSENIEYVILN